MSTKTDAATFPALQRDIISSSVCALQPWSPLWQGSLHADALLSTARRHGSTTLRVPTVEALRVSWASLGI